MTEASVHHSMVNWVVFEDGMKRLSLSKEDGSQNNLVVIVEWKNFAQMEHPKGRAVLWV